MDWNIATAKDLGEELCLNSLSALMDWNPSRVLSKYVEIVS